MLCMLSESLLEDLKILNPAMLSFLLAVPRMTPVWGRWAGPGTGISYITFLEHDAPDVPPGNLFHFSFMTPTTGQHVST